MKNEINIKWKITGKDIYADRYIVRTGYINSKAIFKIKTMMDKDELENSGYSLRTQYRLFMVNENGDFDWIYTFSKMKDAKDSAMKDAKDSAWNRAYLKTS